LTNVKGDDGFASRWSRLKQAEKEPAVALDVEPEATVGGEVEAVDERTDEEVLEELGLPDPETLKRGDNFSVFMAKAVPTRIRNRALRKLWVSDPVFANLDMLIDYGDDFTDAATVIENLQTAYQVGKGFVDRVADLAEKDAAAAEKEAEEQAEEQPDNPADDTADGPVGEPAAELAGADQAEELAIRRGDFGAEPARAPASEGGGEWSMHEPRAPSRQRIRFRVAEE